MAAALDGRSGTGKSYLAARVSEKLDATVVPTDDFFAAELSNADWEERDPKQRARDVLDWRRVRSEALEPLLSGRAARWHAFDFERGSRADGSYGFKPELEVRKPRPVIILEGAYSYQPALCDLLALTILVEAPRAVRRARLALREDPIFLESWYARWEEAEDHYFKKIRPPSSFDLVVQNG